jgi:hypothetical protein
MGCFILSKELSRISESSEFNLPERKQNDRVP